MPPINDIFKLKASDPITLEEGGEAAANLALDAAEQINAGSVQGVVYDESAQPIEGATVKLLNEDLEPLFHTVTDSNGQYSFFDIPDGSYYVTATFDGYKAANPLLVEVEGEIVEQDITLSVDEKAGQAKIYGTVTEDGTGTPIEGAVVLLYLDPGGGADYQFVSGTVTIEDGEYVFENLDTPATATYLLRVYRPGYFTSDYFEIEADAGEIYQQLVQLVPDQNAGAGTISGVITEDDGTTPIPNAFVGLYSATGGAAEELIMVTYTNDEGFYLFVGVEEGDYIIKAKASETTV